jgi:hypothetical protein
MGNGEEDFQQPAEEGDPNNPLVVQPKKPTIPPEIPGVNHMGSAEPWNSRRKR